MQKNAGGNDTVSILGLSYMLSAADHVVTVGLVY